MICLNLQLLYRMDKWTKQFSKYPSRFKPVSPRCSKVLFTGSVYEETVNNFINVSYRVYANITVGEWYKMSSFVISFNCYIWKKIFKTIHQLSCFVEHPVFISNRKRVKCKSVVEYYINTIKTNFYFKFSTKLFDGMDTHKH